jgi:hypothetical protein
MVINSRVDRKLRTNTQPPPEWDMRSGNGATLLPLQGGGTSSVGSGWFGIRRDPLLALPVTGRDSASLDQRRSQNRAGTKNRTQAFSRDRKQYSESLCQEEKSIEEKNGWVRLAIWSLIGDFGLEDRAHGQQQCRRQSLC